LFELHTDDNERSRKGISHAINSEWLAQNCHIQFEHEDQEYGKGDSEVEDTNDTNEDEDRDRIISYRICDVCHRSRPDWMKSHSYMNNGKDRQTMTMCMQLCYPEYQQKRYELLGSGRPTGVIAIRARSKVEDLIMATLEKMHATAADANDSDSDNKGGDLFYDAVALTYDQSPAVREYFHNDRSRTRHHNKRLWPLRYQAFKEYRI
jgi:hypothetical protein